VHPGQRTLPRAIVLWTPTSGIGRCHRGRPSRWSGVLRMVTTSLPAAASDMGRCPGAGPRSSWNQGWTTGDRGAGTICVKSSPRSPGSAPTTARGPCGASRARGRETPRAARPCSPPPRSLRRQPRASGPSHSTPPEPTPRHLRGLALVRSAILAGGSRNRDGSRLKPRGSDFERGAADWGWANRDFEQARRDRGWGNRDFE